MTTADTILMPTAERLAKSSTWERPLSDRTTKRLHHRQIGTIEAMFLRGWIRAEVVQAFEEFETAHLVASRYPITLCRFGEVSGGNSETCPTQRRIDATRSIERMTAAIAYPMGSAALTRLVQDPTVTIEDIGREFCNEKGRQAIGAGKQLLQMALYKLAVGLGKIQPHIRPHES